ncbi:MAG: 3-dehydroquinate synthase [Candidatus Omnitrophica bacterium]|nr:3-dehydroquinate synthase [Candidatus Omnitrophota bacterium]
MKKITVHLKERSYPILIGRGLLSSLGRLFKTLEVGPKVLVVSNDRVASRFYQTIQNSLKRAGFQALLFKLSHGDERDKSEKILTKLWEAMSRARLDRASAIIALGGGVVGDISAFAASTYMRGIALIQIPTTLLAQVDSAIGGKTAIDLASAKNVVGTFHQPKMVVCDVEALRSLNPREFRNSFAEVVKYGMIRNPKLFRLLEQKGNWFFSSLEKGSFGSPQYRFLETIVSHSIRVKARVVEQDERETKGLRMILNYGHTFGHALESASRFKIPHGEAIATGMILAGELARRIGIFPRKAQDRQVRLIKRICRPVAYSYSANRLLSLMKRDKKSRNGKIRLVLPRAIGKVEVCDRTSDRQIRSVLEGCKKGHEK